MSYNIFKFKILDPRYHMPGPDKLHARLSNLSEYTNSPKPIKNMYIDYSSLCL